MRQLVTAVASKMCLLPCMLLCLLLCVSPGLLGGCLDVREFEGAWAGGVVSEPAVRQGFAESVRADPLVLSNVDLQGISATLTINDGSFLNTRLLPVTKFSNDALSSLTFDGRPLRTYLMFAPLASEPDGWPAHLVISLFADDHVELRAFRGNDLFGVFHLERRN